MGVIKDELLEVREKYADSRRTKLVADVDELTMKIWWKKKKLPSL